MGQFIKQDPPSKVELELAGKDLQDQNQTINKKMILRALIHTTSQTGRRGGRGGRPWRLYCGSFIPSNQRILPKN